MKKWILWFVKTRACPTSKEKKPSQRRREMSFFSSARVGAERHVGVTNWGSRLILAKVSSETAAAP
jgi:hypothetical protein